MKSLVDFILENKQSYEDYFAEMLLCEKDSEVVKTIVKEFVNNPNDKFTALGNRAELKCIAEALEIDGDWVKKFKNEPDMDGFVEGLFSGVKDIKNLSGTPFIKCSIAKNDTMIGIDALIEEPAAGEYSFLVVFEF